jgi:surface antigen
MQESGVDIKRPEICISNTSSQSATLRISASRKTRFYKKPLSRLYGTTRTRRRFVRYSLIAGNFVILATVALFVTSGASSSPQPSLNTPTASASSGGSSVLAGPLDQLSSVDIAVNIARTTALPESVAVTNQSDSAKATTEIAAADSAVVAKPQLVSTNTKSSKDIQNYTVTNGDSVASIAAKFNVTSESIRWSNDIKRDKLTVGANIVIPPLNGIVYTVKAGETADTLAQRFGASKEKIIAFNDAEISGIKVGQQILIPDGQAPVATARPASRTATGFSWGSAAVYGYNGYDYGYCTWYVANKRIQIGRALPANLGNAYTWDDRARLAGLSVSGTPQVGDAVVTSTSRNPGHVAFVEAVNGDGTIWISEMNSRGQRSMTDSSAAGGWGRIDYKIISAGGLNYIH